MKAFERGAVFTFALAVCLTGWLEAAFAQGQGCGFNSIGDFICPKSAAPAPASPALQPAPPPAAPQAAMPEPEPSADPMEPVLLRALQETPAPSALPVAEEAPVMAAAAEVPEAALSSCFTLGGEDLPSSGYDVSRLFHQDANGHRITVTVKRGDADGKIDTDQRGGVARGIGVGGGDQEIGRGESLLVDFGGMLLRETELGLRALFMEKGPSDGSETASWRALRGGKAVAGGQVNAVAGAEDGKARLPIHVTDGFDQLRLFSEEKGSDFFLEFVEAAQCESPPGAAPPPEPPVPGTKPEGQEPVMVCTPKSTSSPPVTGKSYMVSNTAEFQAALRKAKPGDAVLLAGGSYTVENKTLKGLGSGTANNPIIIRPAPGAEGKVDLRPAKRHGAGRLYFDGVSHLVIEGLKFHGYTGIVGFKNAHHITFRGNEVYDGYRACFGVHEHSNNILIEGNVIHDCGVGSGGKTKSQSGINGEGMYIGVSKNVHLNATISNITIRNNEIYDTTDEGINIKNNRNTLVENNYLHDIVTSDPGAINFNPGGAHKSTGSNHAARGNVVQDIRGHPSKPKAGIGINGGGGAAVNDNYLCNTSGSPIRDPGKQSGNRINSSSSACNAAAQRILNEMKNLPGAGGAEEECVMVTPPAAPPAPGTTPGGQEPVCAPGTGGLSVSKEPGVFTIAYEGGPGIPSWQAVMRQDDAGNISSLRVPADVSEDLGTSSSAWPVTLLYGRDDDGRKGTLSRGRENFAGFDIPTFRILEETPGKTVIEVGGTSPHEQYRHNRIYTFTPQGVHISGTVEPLISLERLGLWTVLDRSRIAGGGDDPLKLRTQGQSQWSSMKSTGNDRPGRLPSGVSYPLEIEVPLGGKTPAFMTISFDKPFEAMGGAAELVHNVKPTQKLIALNNNKGTPKGQTQTYAYRLEFATEPGNRPPAPAACDPGPGNPPAVDSPASGIPELIRPNLAISRPPAGQPAAQGGSQQPAPQSPAAAQPPGTPVKGISFDKSSIRTFGKGSDQWPMTLAADGSLYAAWGDGWGWSESGPKCFLGVTKITGSAPNLKGQDLECVTGDNKKPRAIFAVGNTLYMYWHPIKTQDTYGAVSTDGGKTWKYTGKLWDGGSDSVEMSGAVNFGPGYTGLPANLDDGYVYAYFYDTKVKGRKMYLARGKASNPLSKGGWEWFSGTDSQGNARWGGSSGKAVVYNDPSNKAEPWYHFISTYNPALGKYFATTFTDTSGGFNVVTSDNPWGPWESVYDGKLLDNKQKFTAQFNQNWMSADGKTMWMPFSGHPEYDSVKVIKVTVQ